MKCIISKSKETIDRVKNEVADKKVSSGNWNYCPKELWKQRVRNKSTMAVVESSNDEKVHGLKAKDRKKLSK